MEINVNNNPDLSTPILFAKYHACSMILGWDCDHTTGGCEVCQKMILDIIEKFGFETVFMAVKLYEAQGAVEPLQEFMLANDIGFRE